MNTKKHTPTKLARADPVKIGPKNYRQRLRSQSLTESLVGIPGHEDVDGSQGSLVWDNFVTPTKLNSVSSTAAVFDFSAVLSPKGSELRDRVHLEETFSSGSEQEFLETEQEFADTDEETLAPNSPEQHPEPEANMADQRDTSSYRRQIRKASMMLEDDFRSFEVGEVTLDFLKSRNKTAEDMKKTIQEAMLHLLEHDEEYYTAHLEDLATRTKADLITFIKDSQKVLRDAETQKTNPSQAEKIAQAAVNAKASRVQKFYRVLSAELEELTERMHAASDSETLTDSDIRALSSGVAKLEVRGEKVVEELRELISDALQCGLEGPAENMEVAIRTFRKDVRSIDSKIALRRKEAGISSASHTGERYGGVDLKVPEFRGDSSDQLDFYSFQTDWKEYVNSKHLSKADELKVLQKTSLTGPARVACKDMKSLEDVWAFLKSSYGNPAMVFSMKVEEFKKVGTCTGSNVKKRDWAVNVQAKLAALHTLAKNYKLEDELYFSSIVPEMRKNLPYRLHEDMKKELKEEESSDGVLSRRVIYEKLVVFLGKFVEHLTFEINYEMSAVNSLDNAKKDKFEPATKNPGKKAYSNQDTRASNANQGKQPSDSRPRKEPRSVKCTECSGYHTHLYYCEEFLSSKGRDRYSLTGHAKVCFRCLRMDSSVDFDNRRDWWRKHSRACETDYICQAGQCAGREESKQYHFTMCTYHVNENKQLEEEFIKSLDKNKLPKSLNPRNIKFFFSSRIFATKPENAERQPEHRDGRVYLPDIEEPSLFLLQNVKLNDNHEALMFYDSGCQGAAISSRAAEIIETEVVRPGPTILDVAGGGSIAIKHGDERFHLDIANSNQVATITGLRMDSITSPFPAYELQEAWEEIQTQYKEKYKGQKLPTVDKTVGGTEVDLMIGIRYNKYFPKLLFTLPGGLGIYRAVFTSARGCQGILGGPHKAWRAAYETGMFMNPRMYLTMEAKAYVMEMSWVRINQDKLSHLEKPMEENTLEPVIPLIVKCSLNHCADHSSVREWTIPKQLELSCTAYNLKEKEKRFYEAEDVGADIQYRCISCRNCSKCRKGDFLEETSLREEMEQALIEDSVKLIPEEGKLEACLPFVEDPIETLKSNRYVAEKILQSQLKVYSKYPEMREDTLKSHDKLLLKGHVLPLDKLSSEERKRMDSTPGDGYVIPWRTVYNTSSLSTPCRMVYDASARTSSGHSLNSTLAKGQNRLARLVDLFIRFRRGEIAVTADISMFYNGLKLIPEHYKFQQYLWKESLDPKNPTVVMIVKTLIYGVKSSGGQTQAGLNVLGDYCMNMHPEHALGAKVLMEETYVDDILASVDNEQLSSLVANDIEFILGLAGMAVKDFTFSGKPPSDKVSADGCSVGVAGYIWEPEKDLIGLNIKDLYLEKPRRGKTPEVITGDFKPALEKKFTRRVLVGKVAQVWDPLGLVTPMTAGWKLDLHTLCKRKLDWDDQVPVEFLDTWVENLQEIQELRGLRFNRALIPKNAANTMISLVVSVDASQHIAVACVHARVLLQDGSYSCQLVLGRSKLVTESTIPKGELRAATIGASTGFIVAKNLGKYFDQAIFVTDSTISLYWINQDERPLKVGVRNAVIEIRRFTNLNQWFHVESANNIADLGTRRASVEEIGENSEWQRGKSWMKLKLEDMPLRTAKEITLSNEQKRTAAVECKAPDVSGYVLSNLISNLGERYAYSDYALDPCRFPWKKSVNTLALVFMFLRKLQESRFKKTKIQNSKLNSGTELSTPSVDDVLKAETYYFKKGTEEVKRFNNLKQFKHCSTEKEGILYYTGRILDDPCEIAVEKTMLDITPVSFVKPMLDRFSPLAYAIMIHSHEHGVHHKNSIVTLRNSLTQAYIINGRSLAEEIREACIWCRRYKRRLLEVEMGKLPSERITIAPPFYHTQVDLMGPFLARCEHNHRSTVKVWGVVFKDMGTSAVAVMAMPKYDTASFVQTYTRFASRYGHVSKLYPDEGGQLIKACKEMEINLIDVSRELNSKYSVGVEYSPCPVGAHNVHGAVERSIREVRKLLSAVFGGLKLDILGYETAFAWISNELNNLPICLGSRYKSLDHQDLITPNRILLGRNNDKGLSGFCRLDKPSKQLEQMEQVFDAWWRAWKNENLIKYIPQPKKWNKTTYQPKPGDIVVFTKLDKDQTLGQPVWSTGRIQSIEVSKQDNLVRVVTIEYKNAMEKTLRTTRRSVRNLAVVHKEGELELIEQLNIAAGAANRDFSDEANIISQQVAVSREVMKCPDCSEPNLCLRHFTFFQKHPIFL